LTRCRPLLKKKKQKEEEKNNNNKKKVYHSFFSFRPKSASISLYHRPLFSIFKLKLS
jgi:hypothetical protein